SADPCSLVLGQEIRSSEGESWSTGQAIHCHCAGGDSQYGVRVEAGQARDRDRDYLQSLRDAATALSNENAYLCQQIQATQPCEGVVRGRTWHSGHFQQSVRQTIGAVLEAQSIGRSKHPLQATQKYP
ncbi:uncharacterized protein N7518_004666, partial [Penicillium psychrosexuale]|uniref:uncharacterized protein n=1 Tax=Penicillium psychrosexuale TaxID=1002107 RepID=UPI002545A6EE